MRRQPAQAVGLAAVSLVAMVGMLAFLVDAGLLFMAHREAQDAADAAALAGVREFTNGDTTCAANACEAAVKQYASGNYGILGRLCSTTGDPSLAVGSLNTPKVPTLSVTVTCPASLTFGRILWDPDHAPIFTIRATAIAAIGNAKRDANGNPTSEITDFTKNPRSKAATGSTSAIVQFVDPQFVPNINELQGFDLQFGAGAATNAGQSRQIISNTGTSITVSPPFGLAPSPNDPFTVLQHRIRLIH
jgi:Putative Flp pilus-assembly TadE/G-like